MRIAVTPGEPAGIGPDLVVSMSQQALPYQLVAIADPDLLAERARSLGLPLTIKPWQASDSAPSKAQEITVLPVPLITSANPGVLNADNAAYVLKTLDKAIDGCQSGMFQAMVTGPVQKSVINDAGIPFSGHTEYLAEKTQTDQVVMMLATEGLRVALVTTHLPLAQVPAAITSELLRDIIHITHNDLQHVFGIQKPRILVCGLNPHAGEDGHMGREEIDIIEPVLRHFTDQGMQLIGPLPADTLFTPKHLEQADAVLAMYHDQGLPVLKHKGFGKAVNITLGLPIIRTSVDHGTALDLAASGKADLGSLQTALSYALSMAQSKNQYATR